MIDLTLLPQHSVPRRALTPSERELSHRLLLALKHQWGLFRVIIIAASDFKRGWHYYSLLLLRDYAAVLGQVNDGLFLGLQVVVLVDRSLVETESGRWRVQV